MQSGRNATMANVQAEQETQILRVLMVEDSALDEKIIRRHLHRHGLVAEFLRVWTEADFRDALEKFAPDIILSDYSMPAFDGKTALKIACELAPQIPFMFVSGTLGEERAIEALKSGAIDYVIKTNLARLGPAVDRALHQAAESRARKEAEEARARLAEILEATPDFVAICDTDHRIQYLNEGACRLIGVEKEALRGRDFSALTPAWAGQWMMREAIPSALRDGTWRGESVLLNASNEEIPVSQVLVAHRNAQGSVTFYSTIARDLRDRKAYESRISYLANYDELTDLPNRALLCDRTVQAMAYAKRVGRQLAIAILNIDDFTLVNEGYDRATGDEVLRQMGQRLKEAIRDGNDTVARVGSDSYALLLTELTTIEEGIAAAQRAIQAVTSPLQVNDHEFHIGVSLGIAVYPHDGEDADELLRNADAAMHRAKIEKRGGIQRYTAQMTSESTERAQIATALQMAAHRSELEVQYQPQFDVKTQRVTGVEALLRWRHPRHGMIPPHKFIPVAEEMGTIRPIGEWVLTQACADALQWRKNGVPITRLGINISARQLQGDIVAIVERALSRSGLPPETLELEVTESGLIRNADEAVNILRRLKSVGVSIAIDDFGTGYSSLSYLSRFPLDRLKIDRSFVHRMTSETRDRQIVQAIVSLARVLQLKVLAEGVETEAQRLLLVEDGCDEGQGFLMSPAVPADKISALVSGAN